MEVGSNTDEDATSATSGMLPEAPARATSRRVAVWPDARLPTFQRPAPPSKPAGAADSHVKPGGAGIDSATPAVGSGPELATVTVRPTEAPSDGRALSAAMATVRFAARGGTVPPIGTGPWLAGVSSSPTFCSSP